MIERPEGAFGLEDVRTAVAAVAQAEAIAVQGFDQNGSDSGATAVQRISDGWEIQPPPFTVRPDIAVK